MTSMPFIPINDNDEIWTVDGDIREEDDDWWDYSKLYTGHDYIAHFGREAWNKLLQARLTRQRNIVLREFTKRLPNISEQVKNGLFDAFSKSTAFGEMEHNALLETLSDPRKGWSLYEWDEYYYAL